VPCIWNSESVICNNPSISTHAWHAHVPASVTSFIRSVLDGPWTASNQQPCINHIYMQTVANRCKPLLTLCCALAACRCFQVIPCVLCSLSPCLLDLERFSYGRGRSRSLIPCPAASMSTMSDIILGVYSIKAVACIRQNMYTADRHIPPSHLLALPCLLSC
jgi:hypothetical protein